MPSDSALKAIGRFSVSVTTPRASCERSTRASVVHGMLSYSIADELLARSRNWNFWILPVLVLGIGSKRISFGTL